MRFEVTILGVNSAIPANGRFPTAQVVNISEQLFLVDCGEGTQMRLNDFGIRKSRIRQVFISHLHGDHFYGLIGLITTFNLIGRTSPLKVYSPAGLEPAIRFLLDVSETIIQYPLEFVEIDPSGSEVIFENKLLKVCTFPLDHRIPTVGFLFREKKRLRHMIGSKIEEYDIPVELIPDIKKGADFVRPDGSVIPNKELTLPPSAPRSYAYCSDTAYSEKIVGYIKDVDLLYHEATFAADRREQAHLTKHSTTAEAALIAKKARAGRLVLGHYSSRYNDLTPLLEEARAVFPNTVLGKEGVTYEVPSS